MVDHLPKMLSALDAFAAQTANGIEVSSSRSFRSRLRIVRISTRFRVTSQQLRQGGIGIDRESSDSETASTAAKTPTGLVRKRRTAVLIRRIAFVVLDTTGCDILTSEASPWDWPAKAT